MLIATWPAIILPTYRPNFYVNPHNIVHVSFQLVSSTRPTRRSVLHTGSLSVSEDARHRNDSCKVKEDMMSGLANSTAILCLQAIDTEAGIAYRG